MTNHIFLDSHCKDTAKTLQNILAKTLQHKVLQIKLRDNNQIVRFLGYNGLKWATKRFCAF